MHYRLGFSSKLENSSVYIECSVRKPGVNHPIREIVKRFGKKKDLLAQDPLALEKIQREVDVMNRKCKGRQLVSSPSSLKSLSSDLSTLLESQSLDKHAMYSRLLPQDIKLCYYTQKHFRRNLIMEPLFVAEWKYDKKTIYELIPLFRKNSVLSSTATFPSEI